MEQIFTEHVFCTGSCTSPKAVKLNKVHFLPEKRSDTTLIFLTETFQIDLINETA